METREPSYHKIDVNTVKDEFYDGFSTLKQCKTGIAIFGSSRLKKDDPYYHAAKTVASELSKKGFSIITGGGPGIMEAANAGAHHAKGDSYGLCIQLQAVEPRNEFVDLSKSYNFDHFFVRKAMFLHHAEAFVCFPGGYGTLDELFECLVMFQMNKIAPKPVYLYGKEFWEELVVWLEKRLCQMGTISPSDVDLLSVVNSPDEVVEHISSTLLKK